MAEAIALVGLASSIVTFLDLSKSLLKAAKSSRDAWHGTTPQVHELEKIVTDVTERQLILQTSLASLNRAPSKTDRITLSMSKSCIDLAKELQELIIKLSRRTDARSQMIESGRVALAALTKQSELKDLETRMKKLDWSVRSNVRDLMKGIHHAEVLQEINEVEQSHLRLEIKYDIKLEEMRKAILSLAVQSREDVDAQEAQLTSLGTKLSSLENELRRCRMQSRVVESLYFPEIKRRWSQIENSENMTNLWLFDSTLTSFPSWLSSEDCIYCITGLAGSGKSTLMKYAFDHKTTREVLKRWAYPANLCMASYFFWSQGFDMQKSQLGLLQSLLYQILKNIPELIPQITTSRAERADHEIWSLDDIKVAFKTILSYTALSTRFCFFIDGLDEYNGEEEEIARLLLSISTSKNIKICASSRPRLVFNSTLWSPQRMLQVNDFTKNDMQHYVRQRLQRNEKFRKLDSSSTVGSRALMNQVAEQAKGVWLWVYLITRDLIYAINRNEGLTKLEDIVKGFPKELDEYFTLIITRIRPSFRDEMARIFLITIQEVQPMPLFAFSLLEEERKNPHYAIEAEISVLTEQPVKRSDAVWKDRIHNRCSDLLIVDDGEHPTFLFHPVDFLHRTVRDFLRDTYFDKLRMELKSEFNPAVSLCKILVFFLKKQPNGSIRGPAVQNRLISLVDELLYHAREAEKISQHEEVELETLLDEVDRVLSVLIKSATKNHWTHMRDSPRARGLDEYREGGKCNFIALAVQCRLVDYVRAKLTREPERLEKGGRPLLDYALRPRRISPLTVPYHSQRDEANIEIDMIKLLLDLGADPNQKIHLNDGRSVWHMFLISCGESIAREEASETSKNAWLFAMELLLEHGARGNTSMTSKNSGMTLERLIHSVMGQYHGERILLKLIENEREHASSQSWAGWIRGFAR